MAVIIASLNVRIRALHVEKANAFNVSQDSKFKIIPVFQYVEIYWLKDMKNATMEMIYHLMAALNVTTLVIKIV